MLKLQRNKPAVCCLQDLLQHSVQQAHAPCGDNNW